MNKLYSNNRSMTGQTFDVFPACLALWARSEPMALPGEFERKRGGEAMNRAKSRVLWVWIDPIQAFSLPQKKIAIVGRGIDGVIQINEKSISRKHLEGHSRDGKEVPNAVTSTRDYLYKITLDSNGITYAIDFTYSAADSAAILPELRAQPMVLPGSIKG